MFSRLKVTNYSRVISKSLAIPQTYSQNRTLHVFLRTKELTQKSNYLGCFSSSSVYNNNFVRYASTNETPVAPVEEELLVIPDAPIVPPEVTEVVGSLESLGLGGYYSPIGWVQHCLFWLHESCGVPWWATIIAGTAVLKLTLLPIYLKMQRHQALVQVHRKELAYFERRRKEATEVGDTFKAKIYFEKQEAFYRDHNMLTVKKMAINYLLQGPTFILLFLALNRMANVPVPSMREGGVWWFTDLTVSDPYYILPIITSASTALYLYVMPNPALSMQMKSFQMVKYVFPAIGLVVMIYLKTSILFYIITSTWMTFLFQALGKVPRVRAFCNIAPIVKQPQIASNDPTASIIDSLKSSWKNMQKNRGKRAATGSDNRQFHAAGRGPLVKTYKYDPTKVIERRKN